MPAKGRWDVIRRLKG